ncbi:hypothetical protein U1Q18_039806, partial [Sarracenia purpurea var. burkii]
IKIGSKKFTKMLDEIYREATELCMDFNCKIAILVGSGETDEESPMIYSFGSPSVESVVKALAADSVPPLSESEERSMRRCLELHCLVKELESETKAEKKRGKELMKRMMKSKSKNGYGPKMKSCSDDEAFMRKLSGLMARLEIPPESEMETATELVPSAPGSDAGEGK